MCVCVCVCVTLTTEPFDLWPWFLVWYVCVCLCPSWQKDYRAKGLCLRGTCEVSQHSGVFVYNAGQKKRNSNSLIFCELPERGRSTLKLSLHQKYSVSINLSTQPVSQCILSFDAGSNHVRLIMSDVKSLLYIDKITKLIKVLTQAEM